MRAESENLPWERVTRCIVCVHRMSVGRCGRKVQADTGHITHVAAMVLRAHLIMDGVGDNEDVRDAPLLADYSPPEIEDGVISVDGEKRARKVHEVLLIAVPEGLGLQLALEAVAKRSDEDDADHSKARNQGKATGKKRKATENEEEKAYSMYTSGHKRTVTYCRPERAAGATGKSRS